VTQPDKENIDLAVLVAALVKKAGGEIRLTEEEIFIVTRQDLITMYFDLKTNEIILRTIQMPLTYDESEEN